MTSDIMVKIRVNVSKVSPSVSVGFSKENAKIHKIGYG